MKYLDDKEVMRGDTVIAPTDGGKSIVAGTIHELYERTNQVRITGYALRVDAADCVLAQEAYANYIKPILNARLEAAAKAKADAEAATKPAETPEAPPA